MIKKSAANATPRSLLICFDFSVFFFKTGNTLPDHIKDLRINGSTFISANEMKLF